MPVIDVVISRGKARAIYSEELVPYIRALDGKIERATYAEPADDGTWYVDLTKFGGGLVRGFETRQAAVDWEIAWLKKHWLNFSSQRRHTSLRMET